MTTYRNIRSRGMSRRSLPPYLHQDFVATDLRNMHAISFLDVPFVNGRYRDVPGARGRGRLHAVRNRDFKDAAGSALIRHRSHVAPPGTAPLLDPHLGVGRQFVADRAVDGHDAVLLAPKRRVRLGEGLLDGCDHGKLARRRDSRHRHVDALRREAPARAGLEPGAVLRDRKVGRAVPASRYTPPYCTTTTTLKNRIAAFSAVVAPSTAFRAPPNFVLRTVAICATWNEERIAFVIFWINP